jgi:uncharacterized protein (TIGR00730 family)
MNLTIFCSGKTNLKKDYIEEIENLIKNIDINKISIVYGGGNVGLMGVVRDSFNSIGGKIITSNLNKFVVEGIFDDYIFDNINERQQKLIELGDVYLILPGGFGTMFEMLEVITKNQIGESKKPILIFNFNNIYDYLLKEIRVLQEENFIQHELNYYNIYVFNNSDELIHKINNI